MFVFISVSRRGSVNEHFPMGCQSMPLTERKGEVLAAWETFEWLTTTRMRYLRRRCKWHINAAAWSAQPFLHSAPGGGYWTTYVASCAASAWDFETFACRTLACSVLEISKVQEALSPFNDLQLEAFALVVAVARNNKKYRVAALCPSDKVSASLTFSPVMTEFTDREEGV